MTLLVGTVGLLAAAPLADLLGVPALAQFWWLVTATVFAIGVYMVLSDWMVRERSYGALGRRNLLQGVGQVATQFGLGLAGVVRPGCCWGWAQAGYSRWAAWCRAAACSASGCPPWPGCTPRSDDSAGSPTGRPLRTGQHRRARGAFAAGERPLRRRASGSAGPDRPRFQRPHRDHRSGGQPGLHRRRVLRSANVVGHWAACSGGRSIAYCCLVRAPLSF